ncbi:MAG: response regulator transcription factor, partial [Thermodesulfobacteriota bacterium]
MSKKILLADDSVTIQKVISITFANEDYQLEIVGDGDEAVRKARELKPDLVMVDVGMPGRNGYEVCEALKSDQALRSTPVMLLAGTFEPLDLSEAERVGADDHIIKPFESQDLLDKVRSLTARAEPARPAPSEPSAAASALDEEPAFDIAEEWGEGDFLGISEEFAKKPDAGAEETGPIPGFDEGFSLEDVSAPTEAKEAAPAAPEASAAPESDFYDIEFNEDELKPEAQAPAEPAGGEP